MEEKALLSIVDKLQRTRREWTTVDAKEDLVIHELGSKAEFVKDVVAMANNGVRSYLVIGLHDGTFSESGKLRCHHSKNDLNQFLSNKIDPPVIIDYQEFLIGGNEFGLVEILGHNPPYIVAQDLVAARTDRKQFRIQKGTIFVRHEDNTEGISRSELEELFRKKRSQFDNETKLAQQLTLERPPFWEHRLTAELLRSKLLDVTRRFDELNRGVLYRKVTRMKGQEFVAWTGTMESKLAPLKEAIVAVMSIIHN